MRLIKMLIAATVLASFIAFSRTVSSDTNFVAEHSSVRIDDRTVTSTTVRFKASTADIRLIGFDDVKNQLEDGDQREGLTIDQYREVANVKLTISLIYLQKYSPPTLFGFVKSKGKVINREVRPTWALSGLFCFKPGKAVLGSFQAIKPDTDDFPNCIQ